MSGLIKAKIIIPIAPPKIGSVYFSKALVQFKKAEKYAFPTSKKIVQTKTFASRKKLIGGTSGIKNANRMQKKIIPAEITTVDSKNESLILRVKS